MDANAADSCSGSGVEHRCNCVLLPDLSGLYQAGSWLWNTVTSAARHGPESWTTIFSELYNASYQRWFNVITWHQQQYNFCFSFQDVPSTFTRHSYGAVQRCRVRWGKTPCEWKARALYIKGARRVFDSSYSILQGIQLELQSGRTRSDRPC